MNSSLGSVCLPLLFCFSSTQSVLTPDPTSTVTNFFTGSLTESPSIQIGMGFMFWIMAVILLLLLFFLQNNNNKKKEL